MKFLVVFKSIENTVLIQTIIDVDSLQDALRDASQALTISQEQSNNTYELIFGVEVQKL